MPDVFRPLRLRTALPTLHQRPGSPDQHTERNGPADFKHPPGPPHHRVAFWANCSSRCEWTKPELRPNPWPTPPCWTTTGLQSIRINRGDSQRRRRAGPLPPQGRHRPDPLHPAGQPGVRRRRRVRPPGRGDGSETQPAGPVQSAHHGHAVGIPLHHHRPRINRLRKESRLPAGKNWETDIFTGAGSSSATGCP